MKSNPITKAHTKIFEGFMEDYQRTLNLLDWRIEHSGKNASSGALAEVLANLDDRLAVWSLGKDWGPNKITEKSLQSTAIHECLHIALKPLIIAALNRDEENVTTLEHGFIIVMEKLLCK